MWRIAATEMSTRVAASNLAWGAGMMKHSAPAPSAPSARGCRGRPRPSLQSNLRSDLRFVSSPVAAVDGSDRFSLDAWLCDAIRAF